MRLRRAIAGLSFGCAALVGGTSLVDCVSDQTPLAVPIYEDSGASSNEGGTTGGSTDAGAATDAGNDAGSQAPPFDLDAACVSSNTIAPRLPVYMELVVDFSGSMMDDNKFTALQSALNTLFDDLGAQADPSIGVGMIAFSDQKDPTTGMGPYPTDADVPLRLVDGTQKTALKTRIATTPMNATPTYPALQGAYPILEALDPASAALPAGGKKVVVLMTDGIPTEPPGDTRPNIIALASAKLSLVAPQGPIYLFSVGIGQFPGNSGTYDPQFLGQLAVAGGTRSSATCNPLETANVGNVCYFQVTPDASAGPTVLEQKFIDAINAIRSQAALCDFDIQVPEGGTVAANQVNVVFIAGSGAQHVVYPNGAKNTDGWTLDNATSPTKVLLHGKSCSDVKTDLKSKISVVLGCTTVAAP